MLHCSFMSTLNPKFCVFLWLLSVFWPCNISHLYRSWYKKFMNIHQKIMKNLCTTRYVGILKDLKVTEQINKGKKKTLTVQVNCILKQCFKILKGFLWNIYFIIIFIELQQIKPFYHYSIEYIINIFLWKTMIRN